MLILSFKLIFLKSVLI